MLNITGQTPLPPFQQMLLFMHQGGRSSLQQVKMVCRGLQQKRVKMEMSWTDMKALEALLCHSEEQQNRYVSLSPWLLVIVHVAHAGSSLKSLLHLFFFHHSLAAILAVTSTSLYRSHGRLRPVSTLKLTFRFENCQSTSQPSTSKQTSLLTPGFIGPPSKGNLRKEIDFLLYTF